MKKETNNPVSEIPVSEITALVTEALAGKIFLTTEQTNVLIMGLMGLRDKHSLPQAEHTQAPTVAGDAYLVSGNNPPEHEKHRDTVILYQG